MLDGALMISACPLLAEADVRPEDAAFETQSGSGMCIAAIEIPGH